MYRFRYFPNLFVSKFRYHETQKRVEPNRDLCCPVLIDKAMDPIDWTVTANR